MGRNIKWPEEREVRLRELFAQGLSWDDIAASLNKTKMSVVARGHKLGLCRPLSQLPDDIDVLIIRLRKEGLSWEKVGERLRLPMTTLAQRARKLQLIDARLHPLPPGHPDSWGLITHGTMLEGSPYEQLLPNAVGGDRGSVGVRL